MGEGMLNKATRYRMEELLVYLKKDPVIAELIKELMERQKRFIILMTELMKEQKRVISLTKESIRELEGRHGLFSLIDQLIHLLENGKELF